MRRSKPVTRRRTRRFRKNSGPKVSFPDVRVYGCVNRPPGYAQVPSGYIATYPDRRFRHGTVEYAEPLSDEQIASFQLQPVFPSMPAAARFLVQYIDDRAEFLEHVAAYREMEMDPARALDAVYSRVRRDVGFELHLDYEEVFPYVMDLLTGGGRRRERTPEMAGPAWEPSKRASRTTARRTPAVRRTKADREQFDRDWELSRQKLGVQMNPPEAVARFMGGHPGGTRVVWINVRNISEPEAKAVGDAFRNAVVELDRKWPQGLSDDPIESAKVSIEHYTSSGVDFFEVDCKVSVWTDADEGVPSTITTWLRSRALQGLPAAARARLKKA